MRRKAVIPASIRLQVITRDNGRCRACGIGDVDALQCDHIVPESRGGKTTLSNLQALCGVCNNRKGQTSVGELPIRERIEGFGDHSAVMADRESFVRMLVYRRQLDDSAAIELAREYQNAGTAGYVIRNRIAKIVGTRKVDRIMRVAKGRE